MAVEILIISGVRRNQRIALDCRAFQVGCDPDCEVFFDPRHDPAAKGRSAKFCLQDGGWYVRCSGGEMWIGTQRIAGATHVRSGDVIRMSDSGPEFSFHIVAAVKVSPANVARAIGIASPRPSGEGSESRLPSPVGRGIAAAAAGVPFAKERDRRWLVRVGGGLAVGILAIVAVRAVFLPSPPSSLP